MSTAGNTEANLKKENDSLKIQIQELEHKLTGLQNELQKSSEGIKNLQALCEELEKQNKITTEVSVSQLADAEKQGHELATEVSTSMEFVQNVTKSIDKISEQNKEACVENADLVEKMKTMQKEHEGIEEVKLNSKPLYQFLKFLPGTFSIEMKKMLLEQCDEVVKLRTEIAQVKLQNANDKERLYTEMQQLASTLLQSREQMKESKETELKLRELLQNYDKKFDGLQAALKETNTAYDGFKGEMAKVCERTKELEKETLEWKDKWAQSNTSLQAANEEHTRVQTGITKSHEGLAKMTSLCRALQEERKQLLDALKRTTESGN